ncbi:MAG: response regulator [Anaerolineae bacterium]|nr:response regulator [Anaerolineae bacterium]
MSTQTRTIIVVNDDPDQVDVLRSAIEQDGVQVVSFFNAQNALDYIRQHPSVDLIVTDLNMVGIDGWQFCRYLRSPNYPQTNKTPILVVSATFAGGNAPNIVRDIGADAFLSVPFRVKQLRQTVFDLLERQIKSSAPTVLLIDADAQERHALSDGFEAHGYQVTQADDGDQGYQWSKTHHPNLIVIHHTPPRIDGAALLPTFKSLSQEDKAEQSETQPAASIILIVLDPSEVEIASHMLQRGADACIYKPFDVIQLIDRAIMVSRERAVQHVESMLEARTQEALRNAERIRQLNEVFVSLGSNPASNIQTLTETAGQLLNGSFAFHSIVAGNTIRIVAEWQMPTLAGETLVYQDAPCSEILTAPDAAPVTIHDLHSSVYAQTLPVIKQYDMQTLVGCPVSVSEQRIGTICVLYSQDHTLTPEDLNTLQLLSRAIGQQTQIQQRNRELALLNDISRIIASTLSLDEMLLKLEQETKNLVNAEACAIALADVTTNELIVRQIDAVYSGAMVEHRIKPGQGIAGWVAQQGKSLLVTNPDDEDHPPLQSHDHVGVIFKDIICAPLIVQERTIGVLELFNKREGQFTDNDLRLIESVAAQVASVIENARLHEATCSELVERTRAEKALRESERRLQTFINVTPDLIFLKDVDLAYQLVNNALAHHLDIDAQTAIGKTDHELVSSVQAVENRQSDQQVLDTGRAVHFEKQTGNRVIEVHKIPVFDDDGQITGIAGVIHDITERKQIEQQRAERQREESISTLAGGIAHDFNNALVGIVGNIGLLRMDFSDVPEVIQSLNAMDLSAQRMVELTNQLLAYAGGGQYQSFPMNISALIEQALQTVQAQVHAPNIVTDCDLCPDLWRANGDPSQIERMLVNLLTNACEAMAESGGILSLKSENVHRQAWQCGYGQSLPGGDYIHVSILDSGPGIDETIQEHLFEPFFTTKFQGRGLGLPAAMGVVRSHKGCIQIESKTGRGTTVHIYLPRSQQPTAQTIDTVEPSQGTILIVEDDSIVRNLAQRILVRQGYKLVLAGSGEEALDIYRQQASEIDLVLLDIGLPQMEGDKVLEMLKGQNAGVKVLLSSGYDEARAIKHAQMDEFTGFIQKPYSLQSLLGAVQELLN